LVLKTFSKNGIKIQDKLIFAFFFLLKFHPIRGISRTLRSHKASVVELRLVEIWQPTEFPEKPEILKRENRPFR